MDGKISEGNFLSTSDKRILIAPSILSADFSNLREEMRCVADAGADWLHLDVMDGQNVPNITFGAPVIAKIRPHCSLLFDAHLMINHPERFLEDFFTAGVDAITIPAEISGNIHEILIKIRGAGKSCGVALNPDTPVSAIEPYLSQVDLVLVMAVQPGFAGQQFNPVVIEKIRSLVRIRADSQPMLPFRISVDGGINAHTAKLVRDAGGEILVAGSYIFGHEDYRAAIDSLKQF